MGINDDYFMIEEVPRAPIPMIGEDDIPARGPVDATHVYQYVLCKPIPKNYILGDYCQSMTPILSKRVIDVIRSFDPADTQYLKLVLNHPKGKQHEDHMILYVHAMLEKIIDIRNSDVDYDPRDDFVTDLRSFRLDKKALSAFPEASRLVFVPRQAPASTLFHKSVVDAIMALEPSPTIRFVPVSQWGDSYRFQQD